MRPLSPDFADTIAAGRTGWRNVGRGWVALSLVLLLAASLWGQADGTQRWAFSTLSSSSTGNIVSSPAVGPDGTIYIGVEVGASGGTSVSGRLFAINPDGSLKWSYTAPDWVDSVPAIAPDGTIYFGCWDGNVYALNPDGTKKWAVNAGAFVASSPALGGDGTVYIGSGGSTLYAINPDGTVKWTFPVADWIDSSPAVASDGTIYFGSWDSNIYAVRSDGTEKWHYTTGGNVVGSPAIAADGTVYVGSRDLALYALTPNGVLKWSVGTGDTIEASPVLGADGAIYVATTGGRLFAFNADGTERWRYPRADQAALSPIYSSAAVRADGSILFGTSNNAIYALKADGTLLWKTTVGDWADSSPLVTAAGSIYLGCTDKKLYAFAGNGQPLDPSSPWPGFRRDPAREGRVSLLTVGLAPVLPAVSSGGSVTLTAAATVATGSPAPSYQWQFNGGSLTGATSASLTVANFQPTNAGLYTAFITNSANSVTSDPAVVGLSTTSKVVGAGTEIAPNVIHPNGNFYDQVLLQGAAATITADPSQVTRISYIDLTDDIVQIEFSGAGTLSLVLDNPSGPALPVNYNQAASYMKGHAGIVIAGADGTTNVSVFTVGRATAFDPTGGFNILQPISATNDPANNGSALFQGHAATAYDGIADIAFIAISSTNGQFGGIRTANASYLATKGLTGIYAPGVQFTGPVYAGDINAWDAATPVLVLGSASETRITGGDLLQANGKPVTISGVTQLKFTAGSTSGGTILSAQSNKAQLQQDGAEVTAQVVVNPSP